MLFTFIDLFHKVHLHHIFTFMSLPQFLASPVIFTNWRKQGVTPRSRGRRRVTSIPTVVEPEEKIISQSIVV
jgi:hypothetical protein